MTVTPKTSTDTQAYTSRRLFSRLWRDYLVKHKYWLVLALFLMIVEGSTLALLAKMLEPLFDVVFIGGDADAVWWIGGIIFGLFAVRGSTDLIKKTVLARVSQKSSTEMQTELLRHLLSLDSGFFHKNSPGALMERVQGDTLAVQGVWAVVISGIGRDFFSLAWLFAVALSIDWLWTLVAVISVPLLILPVGILQRYIRRKTQHMREQASLRSTRLDEVFHGINPIKLNQMESYQMERFERIVDRIVLAAVKTEASRAMIPSLVDIVTGLGFFCVLVIGGADIISGEKSVGQFMSFFTAMSLTFQPLRRLGGIAGTWQVAATSLERLYRLFDEKPSILQPTHSTAEIRPGNTELRLEDVHLSYGDLPALNGASFIAEAGKTTALIGASGAGKSTIFNVLTRLVEPQSGQVTLGGQAISGFTLDDLRAHFSVVSQETPLFDETIRENILLGQQNVPEDTLKTALDAAHVSDFLSNLPEGLETHAGPRGSNLSGGQRQRVAIARALLRDTPVLLLDEATSALDAHSEAAVQEALDRLSKGRTTLVIAHRLSTIQSADKIVVMDSGRVVDEGTHNELLDRGGIYADLYALQVKSETN
ncbi:ABC transporter ATP-binding protein [Pseudohalocynthiibacter sp. F2068]|uniref:ABC transporter ATP-binding protein n=1 Tax=Pseudohalocynthiibacter sp. F2068 TaxID=2926418 RepID=UPI0032B2D8ED